MKGEKIRKFIARMLTTIDWTVMSDEDDNKYKTILREAKHELDQLIAENAELKEQNAHLGNMVNDYQSRYDSQVEQSREDEKVIERLRIAFAEQINDYLDKIDNLEQQLETDKEVILSHQKRLEEQLLILDELEQQLEEKNAENAELKESIRLKNLVIDDLDDEK